MRTSLNDHWTFRIYAKNLTDEDELLQYRHEPRRTDEWHLGGTPIQPRTYGLEVDYRF